MHDKRLIGFASGRRRTTCLNRICRRWVGRDLRHEQPRSLQSIFCSSILDNDYDARQKIDRVLVPRRDAADPALRIAVAGWAVTSGCGMSNLIRFGINRNLQSISCSSILDNDYDARQKIDRVLVPRRDAADPALRIAVAGWAVTSGCGMSNLIRFGINRSLQSILCSSIFDYDYDARHKIDRAVPLSIAIGIAIETSRPSSTRAKRTVWLLHSARHRPKQSATGR